MNDVFACMPCLSVEAAMVMSAQAFLYHAALHP